MSKIENLEREIKNINIKIKKLEIQRTLLENKRNIKVSLERQQELKNSTVFSR